MRRAPSTVAGIEDGRGGHKPRNASRLSELEKARRFNSPLEPPERNVALLTPGVSSRQTCDECVYSKNEKPTQVGSVMGIAT